MNVPFSVDVGLDDVIVPEASLRRIAARLEGFEEPEIYIFSAESAIAEKFDIILDRMEDTSRMKDFFDLYFLSNVFDLDGTILCEALRFTLQHRSRNATEDALARMEQFPELGFFGRQWESFQPARDSGLCFSVVIERIMDLMGPIYRAVPRDDVYLAKWVCDQGRWVTRLSSLILLESSNRCRRTGHLEQRGSLDRPAPDTPVASRVFRKPGRTCLSVMSWELIRLRGSGRISGVVFHIEWVLLLRVR